MNVATDVVAECDRLVVACRYSKGTWPMQKTPDLTPITTTFNGHRFRSRLEARWAVFFALSG